MGPMFTKKKSGFDVSPTSPVFYVRHAGYIRTDKANGPGCTNVPVEKILRVSKCETDMKRVAVTINASGIAMHGMDGRENFERKFRIEEISYCCADREWRPNIFAWIHAPDDKPEIESADDRKGDDRKADDRKADDRKADDRKADDRKADDRKIDDKHSRLFCHAVLCSTPEKAQAMALVLARCFHVAYSDWKISKNKTTEKETEIRKRALHFANITKPSNHKERTKTDKLNHKQQQNSPESPSEQAVSGPYSNNMDTLTKPECTKSWCIAHEHIMDNDDYVSYSRDENVRKLLSGEQAM